MILVTDPSLTCFGYAVLSDTEEIITHGTIRSDSSQNFEDRISNLALYLNNLITNNNIDLIISELPHGSQSYSAARALAASTATLTSIAAIHKIKTVYISESDSKKNLHGKCKNIDKSQTVEKIEKLFPNLFSDKKYPNYHREAISDALSVLLCYKNKNK